LVVIARASMAQRKLLILDEPSLGLAPTIVETVFSWPGAGWSRGCTAATSAGTAANAR
jgi:ABC-type sugar transport system ATPase subunit